MIYGAQGRNRTTDTRIFSPLLYRLSYLGVLILLLNACILHVLAMLRIAPLLIPASDHRLLSFDYRFQNAGSHPTELSEHFLICCARYYLVKV